MRPFFCMERKLEEDHGSEKKIKSVNSVRNET